MLLSYSFANLLFTNLSTFNIISFLLVSLLGDWLACSAEFFLSTQFLLSAELLLVLFSSKLLLFSCEMTLASVLDLGCILVHLHWLVNVSRELFFHVFWYPQVVNNPFQAL